MNKIIYISLSLILAISLSSCNDWLDVNVDPDNANSESVLVSNRLPWIQRYYQYSAGVTNYRTSCQAGVFYSSSSTPNALSVTWACPAAATTTPYQTWFVGAASNLNDMYDKAEAEGAYDYMAAADVFHALGFMEMLDLYGEIPYTEALSGVASPTYDDGKTIFNGCIAKLDEAIALFGKTQESSATSFETGDMWFQGDVSKWIKLCYGLKARYLLKLSKKSDLYDPDTILDCLSKGPQSNDDDAIGTCYNSASDVTDYLWGDPVMTNGNWDYAAYGSTQRISQYYYNLLTNMRGSSVVDPRMTKIVPASMSNIKLASDGTVSSYSWLRSKGVDFYGASTRLLSTGAATIQLPTYADADKTITYTISDATTRDAFATSMQANHTVTESGTSVSVVYKAGSIYVNSTNYLYAGDTIYVTLRNNSYLTGNSSLGVMNMNWYFSTAAMTAGAVGSTGSFQIRPNSDQEILTYHEMCFIKAEVYFRKGDKESALAAYQEGIQAHMDMMQSKLTEWESAGYTNPDMWPMSDTDISTYMSSAAVCQSSSELTLSDIMLQKYVAMGCSLENWNDMRRLDYSAGDIEDYGVIYSGYDRGPLFTGTSQITGTDKTDPTYWMRRWMLPATLELSYNTTNALAMNVHAADANIWCYPVWWDCATDDEYYAYIQGN